MLTWPRTTLANTCQASDSRGVKPKPTELPQQQPIVVRVNIIAQVAGAPGGSRFIEAGQLSPYREISEVPENFRPFIVSGEPETEPPADEPRSPYVQPEYAVRCGPRR
jgi:hypothetical protein